MAEGNLKKVGKSWPKIGLREGSLPEVDVHKMKEILEDENTKKQAKY